MTPRAKGAPDTAAPNQGVRPRRRPPALAAALLCITLPGAVVLVEGASYHVASRSTGAITVNGHERAYLVHVPRSHDPSRPAPLVVSLHSAGLWASAQRDISEWNELADHEGFVVAYPSGVGRASPRKWSTAPGPALLRDVDFIVRMIDTLVAEHGLDPERVYVNGLSNGGGMTFALSCAAPERIAAAGIVAGAQTLGWELCPERVMPPVIVVHGTEDPVVPYRGGRTWIAPRPFPDVAGWVGTWAERNRCDAASVDGAYSATVTRRRYTGCAAGADVVLYTVHGDGHVWPGGGPMPNWLLGPDSGSLDATSVIWEFFRGRRAGE
jgi:polyhydroxybutyrate depolymerase